MPICCNCRQSASEECDCEVFAAMTRGRRSKRSAALSATHVVLLLALAAATSLPAAHAAVTVDYLKSSSNTIYFLSYYTARYLNSADHASYTKTWTGSIPSAANMKDWFDDYATGPTGQITGMEPLQDLSVTRSVDGWDFSLSFHCGDPSDTKTANFRMTGSSSGYHMSGFNKNFEDVCVPASECPAVSVSGYGGSCTSATATGSTCELTCPSGSSVDGVTTTQTLQCHANGTLAYTPCNYVLSTDFANRVTLPTTGADAKLDLRLGGGSEMYALYISQTVPNRAVALEYLEITDTSGRIVNLSSYTFINEKPNFKAGAYPAKTVVFKTDYAQADRDKISTSEDSAALSFKNGWKTSATTGENVIEIVFEGSGVMIETIKYRPYFTTTQWDGSIPNVPGLKFELQRAGISGVLTHTNAVVKQITTWNVAKVVFYPSDNVALTIGTQLKFIHEPSYEVEFFVLHVAHGLIHMSEIEFYEGATKISANVADHNTKPYSDDLQFVVGHLVDGVHTTRHLSYQPNIYNEKKIIFKLSSRKAITSVKLIAHKDYAVPSEDNHFKTWTIAKAESLAKAQNNDYLWSTFIGADSSWAQNSSGTQFCKHPSQSSSCTSPSGDITIPVPKHSSSLKFVYPGGSVDIDPFPFSRFYMELGNNKISKYQADDTAVSLDSSFEFDSGEVTVSSNNKFWTYIRLDAVRVYGSPSILCGDGMMATGISNEQCDDGNRIDGDGCSSLCQIEATHSCSYIQDVLDMNVYKTICRKNLESVITLPNYGENTRMSFRSPQYYKNAKRLIIEQYTKIHLILEYLQITDTDGSVLDLTHTTGMTYNLLTNPTSVDVNTQYPANSVTFTYAGSSWSQETVLNKIKHISTNPTLNTEDGWGTYNGDGYRIIIVTFPSNLRIEKIEYRFRQNLAADQSMQEHDGFFGNKLTLEYEDGTSIVNRPLNRNIQTWDVLKHTSEQLSTMDTFEILGPDIQMQRQRYIPIKYAVFTSKLYQVKIVELEFYFGTTKIDHSEVIFNASLSTYHPSHANGHLMVDGNTGTVYTGDPNTANTFVFEFTTPKRVTHFKLIPHNDLETQWYHKEGFWFNWNFHGVESVEKLVANEYEWTVGAAWDENWPEIIGGTLFCNPGGTNCGKPTGTVTVPVPEYSSSIYLQSDTGTTKIPFPFTELDLLLENVNPNASSKPLSYYRVDDQYTTMSEYHYFTSGPQTIPTPSMFGTLVVGDKTAAGDSSLLCGDGIVNGGEQCDDNNVVSFDGCSANCAIEPKFNCTGVIVAAAAPFVTHADGQCVNVDTTCGDGFVDNNIAYHRQQQYRRVPFSEMIANQQDLDTGRVNPENILNPYVCATKNPQRVYGQALNENCDLLHLDGSATNDYDGLHVSWKRYSKTISKLHIYGQSWYLDYKIRVKLYSGPTNVNGLCQGDPIKTYTHGNAAWKHTYYGGSASQAGGGHISILQLSPIKDVSCVQISGEGSSWVIFVAVKIYEAIGHIEECDGESYCDPETCQLLPNAYCKPRPSPVPDLIFSAKRSQFQYNYMYSGLATYLSTDVTHWPRLESITPHIIIGPSFQGSGVVLSGFDMQFAGGPFQMGPPSTFTAIFKIKDPGETKPMFSFSVNGADFNITYDGTYIKANEKVLLGATNRQYKYFMAIVFDGTQTVNTYLAVFATDYGMLFWHDTYGVGAVVTDVKLKTVHASDAGAIDYIKVMSLHTSVALTQAQVEKQFEFQDQYGAGRNCTEEARFADGVVDHGEECDDGNTVANDGCHNGVETGGNWQCQNSPLWTNVSAGITTIQFRGAADVEEVQVYAKDGSLLQLASSTNLKLRDGIWNVPGETDATRSQNIDGQNVTLEAPVQHIEYIRIFNSRKTGYDSHKLSDVEFNVQNLGWKSVGYSVNGEWTGSNSHTDSSPGSCSDAQYPCYVDVTHDATQTSCAVQCDVSITNGACGSSSPLGDGETCNVVCNGGYVLTGGNSSVTCSAAFDRSSLPTCVGNCVFRNFANATSTCSDSVAIVNGNNCDYTCDSGFIAATENTYHCNGVELKPKSIPVTVTGSPGSQVFVIESTSRLKLNLVAGEEYTFDLTGVDRSEHPFEIKEKGGTNKGTYSAASKLYTFTPVAGKTYEYYCTKHTGMGADIIVQADQCVVGCNTASLSAVTGASHTCGSGSLVPVDTQCPYNCDSGYEGTVTAASCQADGTFTAPSGTCNKMCDVSSLATVNYAEHTCGSSGYVSAGTQCPYNCSGGFEGTVSAASCQADGTFTAPTGTCSPIAPSACNAANTAYERGDGTCKCKKGYVGAGCEEQLRDRIPAARRKQDLTLTPGGTKPEITLPTGRKAILKTNYNIPKFNVFALTNKTEANIHVVASTKIFKQLLRFETVDVDSWTASGNEALTVEIEIDPDDGYNPATHKPRYGVFINETDGETKKHVTRFLGGKIEFDMTSFSLHGVEEVVPVCGNGKLENNGSALEGCDDGNTVDGDGCSSTCTVETGYSCNGDFNTPSTCNTVCGDGIMAGSETCDDSNTNSGDGCSSVCQIENNAFCNTSSTCYQCTTCATGFYKKDCGNTSAGTCAACTTASSTQYYSTDGGYADACAVQTCAISQCGTVGQYVNGCGNGNNGTCSDCARDNRPGARYLSNGQQVNVASSCTVGAYNDGTVDGAGPSAADGVTPLNAEQCDNPAGSANTYQCANGVLSAHYQCVGGDCTQFEPKCGSGLVNGSETCDDGNTASLDGCSSSCSIEVGWNCVGGTSGPSSCSVKVCGDGEWAEGPSSNEQCDDGNTDGGDGCSSSCQVETGYACTRQAGGNKTICYIIGKCVVCICV